MVKKLHLFSLATYILTLFVAIFEFVLIDRILETESNSCRFLGSCNYSYSSPHLKFLESFLVLAMLFILIIASGINIFFRKKKNFWLNFCFNIVWVIQANTSFHVFGIRSMFFNDIIPSIYGYFLFVWCILSWLSLLVFIVLSISKFYSFTFVNIFSLKVNPIKNKNYIILISIYAFLIIIDSLLPLIILKNSSYTTYSNPLFWILVITCALLIIPLILKALPAFLYVFILSLNVFIHIFIFFVIYDKNLIAALVTLIVLSISLFGLVFCLRVHLNKNFDIAITLNLMILIPFLLYFLVVRTFNALLLLSIISFVTLLTFLIINFITLNKQKMVKNDINDKN